MSEIKNIVFDVGGVFIVWDPFAYFRKFFSTREEAEQFMEKIDFDGMNYLSDKGELTEEIIKKPILKYPQYADIIRGYYANWAVTVTGEVPGTLDLLLDLKGNGYKIYGLSNFEKSYFDLMSLKYDFAKHFDGLIISSEVKAVKPEEEIYRILLEKYKLTAEECVFLDDRLENIEAAEKIGFKGIVFTSAQEARSGLKKLKIRVES
jgi:2-haloacid dehalogenase